MGSLYSPQQTWLHRLAAWRKLLFVAVFGSAQFLVQHTSVLLLAALLCCVLIGSLGAAAWQARRLLLSLLIVVALLLLFHAVMGTPMLGLQSAARVLCASLLGIALTLTTRPTDLIEVLERLLTPLGIFGLRVDRLALRWAMMLRFTEHFFVLWRRLDDAHRVRTGRAGGWRLFAPLMIQMLRSAQRVADTLALRIGQ